MAVNDVYRISVIFSSAFFDGDAVNVLDFRQTVIVIAKTEPQFCSELAAEVGNAYVNNYMADVADVITLERVECFNVTQPTFQAAVQFNVPGTLNQPLVSPRSSVVVSKNSGLRGRSFNGRLFLLPPTETQQDAGNLTVPYEAIVQTFVTGLIALILSNLNQYKLVVFSTKLGLDTLVATMITRTILGTIRGRRKVA